MMTDITDNNDFKNSFCPNLANKEDHNGEGVETQDGDEEKIGIFTANKQKIIENIKISTWPQPSRFKEGPLCSSKYYQNFLITGRIEGKSMIKKKPN